MIKKNSLRNDIDEAVEWTTSNGLVPYPLALDHMEAQVNGIIQGTKPEQIWLLEHPPLYTAGTSSKLQDLLAPQFPVYETGRGGQYTYHGPGQRVAYVMLDLNTRGKDLRAYIKNLETWIIQTLHHLNLDAFTREGRVGVWLPASPTKPERKIAAIGVRIRKWVTFHGIALNVHPDLSHFKGIVPCGLREFGVTSLHQEGITMTLPALDQILYQTFRPIFEDK